MPSSNQNQIPTPDNIQNMLADAELITYIEGVVSPALAVAKAEDILGTDKTRLQSFEEREARIYGQEDLALMHRLIEEGVLTDPRFRETVRRAHLEHRAAHNQMHGPLDSEPPK
jgi:hypothetical protein